MGLSGFPPSFGFYDRYKQLPPLDSIKYENIEAVLDKSFSNVVVRWTTICPYLVARPKMWLPRNYFGIIRLNLYVESYEKRLLGNIYRGLGVMLEIF